MTDDLTDFVEASIKTCQEREDLDFKEMLELTTNSQKEELAKDIAAMANTIGGCIIIGVSDGKCGIIGIDSNSFNQSKIHQIASTRPSPSILVSIDIIEIESKDIAIISIPHTGLVHELKSGRVPVRRGETTHYVSVQEIFEMKLQEFSRSSDRIREIIAEEPSDTSSGAFHLLPQQRKQAENLLHRYAVHASKSMLSIFSEDKKEQSFLNMKRYARFCRAFLDATEVSTSKPIDEIGREKLDLIAFRAYGILAQLLVGKLHRHKDFSEMRKMKPFELKLKIDPSSMFDLIENPRWNEKDGFFEWAQKFTNYTEEPFDREMMAIAHTKSITDTIAWISENFEDVNEGLRRGSYLLSLSTEMNNRSDHTLDKDRTSVWRIPLALMRKRVSDLRKDLRKS